MAHQSALIENDILAYLKSHEEKTLLRFITCGSVDDGKSTLIGRLLWDSKMVFEDQLASLEADTLPKIIQEMLLTRTSERQGRLIDHDQAGSMEKKKQEGYF